MLVQERLRENFPRHHTEFLLLEMETNMGDRELGAEIPGLKDHPYPERQSSFLNMAATSASQTHHE